MKRILLALGCALLLGFGAYAAGDEVVVEVSVPGQRVTGKARRALEAKANELAVKKYLLKQNKDVPERVLFEAVRSAPRLVEGDPDVEDEPEAEDGEVTATYMVTIDQEKVAAFLTENGVSSNTIADGTKLELFVMEEPPDAGQIQLGDSTGNFFFSRYNMFQRRIRDALVKKANNFGFEVILLEDNENYEEMKKRDPVLVGVSYDVNSATRGFVVTPNFLRTVQENNPDAIALYYRIDALIYNPADGEIRVSVSLSFKNLAANTTQSIGSRDIVFRTRSKTAESVMADFGTAVERAINAVLNGEKMGSKLIGMATSMRNAASRPQGPMKLVVNCSKVDKAIRIRFRTALKKAIIARGISTAEKTKIVKDSLSCVVTRKDIGDLDDLWAEVSDIIVEAGVEDITDDAAKKNGRTLTVTPGK